MLNSQNRLPWRIEAFREYLSYETLQPTASVLKMFEGEVFSVNNPKIIRMQNLLQERTGKLSWIPNRTGSEEINWNIEGDVTRNKGRIFTSMLILYPKEWCDNKIQLTKFGNALGEGRVSKHSFYDFIISNFKYPHPAWQDNWAAWSQAHKSLLPFVYILDTLLELYSISPDQAYISTHEVADYLHPDPQQNQVAARTQLIIEARKNSVGSLTLQSDEIHRKISDILGFLCLTQYCHFEGKNIRLTTLDSHIDELVNFSVKRSGQDKIEKLKKLSQEAKLKHYGN